MVLCLPNKPFGHKLLLDIRCIINEISTHVNINEKIRDISPKMKKTEDLTYN